MIILDTNVISELMKPVASEIVINWLDQQESIDLFITTITIAEISYGLNNLPKGKKRTVLENAFNTVIMQAFKHRVLTFHEPASHLYGKIMGHRKKLGHPLSILDGQIAAIAAAYGYAVATRNVHDFINCDVEIINPFVAD